MREKTINTFLMCTNDDNISLTGDDLILSNLYLLQTFLNSSKVLKKLFNICSDPFLFITLRALLTRTSMDDDISFKKLNIL